MRTKSGAKLLDFGLAKAINHDSDVSRTVAGLVLGTVAYMSPEQAEGKPLDARSDIFSFGALLYEMLTGRRPFAGDTTAALISAVLRDEPAPLVAPAALQQIVRRCLAKEAAQRFGTMREVTAALAHVTPTLVDRPSIAVLPFSSLSPDPENEYFSDGIAEEIINALTQIKGLHVAARTSSFSFKGKPIPVGEIAARLNVRHVLEGSVRKAGDRVRVTAQLVDSSNGYQLWSERYDRELADIFDVQDQIARAIVDRLKVALVHDQPTRLVKVTTENIEAYQHYLKGRATLYRRGPWIPRALESFQTAVALDPDYAQAWAGVADCLYRPGLHRRPTARSDDAGGAASRHSGHAPRSGVDGSPQRAGGRRVAVGTGLREGRTGVPRGPRAQSAIPAGPLLVRSLPSAVGHRTLRRRARPDPAGLRRRSALELRHDGAVVRPGHGRPVRGGAGAGAGRRSVTIRNPS